MLYEKLDSHFRVVRFFGFSYVIFKFLEFPFTKLSVLELLESNVGYNKLIKALFVKSFTNTPYLHQLTTPLLTYF